MLRHDGCCRHKVAQPAGQRDRPVNVVPILRAHRTGGPATLNVRTENEVKLGTGMPFNTSTYRVMIASPGDVEAERRIARNVVHAWNNLHSLNTNIVLLPVAWETHSFPDMGDRPQAIINKQILRDCDLLIGIFWSRVGTPTGQAASGTVEEINEHIAAGKPAMIYFSARPLPPDKLDKEQYDHLCIFREKCSKAGLVEQFKSRPDFERKLTSQLALSINGNPHHLTHKIWRI